MVGKAILLVEDDPGLGPLVNRLLVSSGYHVFLAQTGEEALEVWKNAGKTIPVALVDLTLPGNLTGRDVVRSIRADSTQVQIIITSGSVANPQTDLQDSEGITFLQKPYVPRSLVAVIEKAFQRATLAASTPPPQGGATIH